MRYVVRMEVEICSNLCPPSNQRWPLPHMVPLRCQCSRSAACGAGQQKHLLRHASGMQQLAAVHRRQLLQALLLPPAWRSGNAWAQEHAEKQVGRMHCQLWVLGVSGNDNRSNCLQALKVGGASADFSSILAAISAAPPGSVIQIAEGRLVACIPNTQAPVRGLAERPAFRLSESPLVLNSHPMSVEMPECVAYAFQLS